MGNRAGEVWCPERKCLVHMITWTGRQGCPQCELDLMGDLIHTVEWNTDRLKIMEGFGLNKSILIGNLTKGVELRYIASGGKVAKFTLAVNSTIMNKRETFFIEVEVWGQLAEKCSEVLYKGSKAAVEGCLKLNKWEFKGRKYEKTVIVATSVDFLSPPEKYQVKPGEIPSREKKGKV